MKAHFEFDWPKRGYNLYLFHEGRDYRVPICIENGSFIIHENATVQVGEELPRTLFIPFEFYEVIRAAMIGEAIDNDDALKDTRMVRDRLLTMIEAEWKSRQLEVK